MANSTPSSVLYELAKSNKMSVHYQVVNETGPAHQKIYKIHLRVGNSGPFEGIGNSLKNARNAAASRALSEGFQGLHINPTVELNILSMKSGEVAAYRELESMSLTSRSDNYDSLFFSQNYNSVLQRSRNYRVKRLWRMSVTICGRTYIGEGHTKSEARGNAASNALRELKPILLDRAKMIELELAKQKQAAIHLGKDPNVETLKSPCYVSKLHELVNRHRLGISFQEVNETGPPHVRMFHIRCKVEEREVIGQGIGKRVAKNDAAQKMLDLLKDLPPPEPKKNASKQRQGRKKTEKRTKVDNGIDPTLNAMAYLNQLMNTRKETLPVYTLKADAGPSQKGLMRFQVEAALEEFKAAGYGETKKAAKNNAATNLLKTLGIDLDELRKTQGVKEDEDFSEDDDDETEIINLALDALKTETAILNLAPGASITSGIILHKVILNNVDESFPTAKQKVEYIARTEGFQLLYNDFVQENKMGTGGGFSSSLAVFTTPPEVFQGYGVTVEASREEASLNALLAMKQSNEQKS